jgi:DNA-binding protein HU-beta
MTTHLKTGDRIRMSGLGILEVKTQAARNPATGESIQIKASRKVAFRPGQGTQRNDLGNGCLDTTSSS